MKPSLSAVLAVCVLLGILVYAAVTLWPQGSPDPYAAGPASPRLVVDPADRGYMMAQMEGTLGVNEHQCVTFDGDVLLAPYGAQVTPDGKHISFPGYAPIRIGASLVGGGGNYPPISDLSGLGWDDDLVDALRRCVGGDRDVGVVQFWLSRD